MLDIRIDPKYLPTRCPGIMSWLVFILALDYWKAPGWAWGAVVSFWGLATIGSWIVRLKATYVHPAELPGKGQKP